MNTLPANTNARDEVDPWPVTKVEVFAVTANYLLVPVVAVVFCSGWLCC